VQSSILLIEDESALQMTLGDGLRTEGYAVEVASDGNEGFQKAFHAGFDLILLDLTLPAMDGLSICQELRRLGVITPILMLTARSHVRDRVYGLKTGADDYVTKPFDLEELIARVEALLRRAPSRPLAKQTVWQIGDIHVDLLGTEMTRGGKRIALSAREFQLLQYLIEHSGETVPREDLLREVWGYKDGTFTRTLLGCDKRWKSILNSRN
jgi:DNA-binding response OmpR family regulator